MITTEASAKIAGYLFQFQRALYVLFSSEESNPIIGIETEDDIVNVNLNSQGKLDVNLEQDKHSVNQGKNPYQDSSKNLWHTLHIWLDSMKETRDKYDNISYFLATNQDVPTSSFAYKFSSANDEKEINECINMINEHLLSVNLDSDIGKTVQAVAGFPKENLHFLIKNISLKDNGGTANGGSIKDSTINLLQISPEFSSQSEQIYTSLLGLLVDTCQSYWIRKQPAWIVKSVFTTRLQSELSDLRINKYLERPLISTAYKEYMRSNNKSHHFLSQLKSLNLNDSFCDRALSFYWGFYAEKIRLEEIGEILPSQWESRNQALHERWKIIEDNTRISSHDEKTDNVLNKILVATLDHNFTAPLGSFQTSQPYFTAGNYQYLANDPLNACYVCWNTSLPCPKG